MIGIDPELNDPESRDYSLAPGSPAVGYGCQTFAAPDPVLPAAVNGNRIFGTPTPHHGRRDEIVVSGPVTVDTTWDADTVRVVGDVSIDDGVVLTIAPGVRVEFEGYYRLTVSGTLLAVGTPAQMIVFTTDEPKKFRVDRSLTGCWNGIRFDGTPATNDPSRLEYCVVEYSKAVDTSLGRGADTGRSLYPYGGGALSAQNVSKLVIANSIIRHNVAEFGGAFFLYHKSSPLIVNNLLTGNHALYNASVVYCGYSYPVLINNTIVDNPIHNGENPYEETAAILNFLSKPRLENNIIRGNDPDVMYIHAQLWQGKDYYTRHNNLEGYTIPGTNIDADPIFRPGPRGDHYLSQTAAGQPQDSPCLDAGSDLAQNLFTGDEPGPGGENGATRMSWLTTRTDGVSDAGQVDMGYHYPWQSVSAGLSCVPSSGTLPFSSTFSVGLLNAYGGFSRTVAARIDATLAGGQSFSNWRSGHTNISAGSSFDASWSQAFPALGSLAGANTYTLTAEDVTPSPYNQPPHPPSGDTDASECTVMGIAP